MSKNIEIQINTNGSNYEILYPKVDLGNVTNISTLANNLKDYFHSSYVELKRYTGTGTTQNLTIVFTPISGMSIVGVYYQPQYMWVCNSKSSGEEDTDDLFVPQFIPLNSTVLNQVTTYNAPAMTHWTGYMGMNYSSTEVITLTGNTMTIRQGTSSVSEKVYNNSKSDYYLLVFYA